MLAPKVIRVILGCACLGVLFGILAAGLRPFNPRPSNNVTWLAKGNGLEFRPNGIVVIEEPFPVQALGRAQSSLELWLQPAIDDTAPILCFYRVKPKREFLVLQYGDTLLLQTRNRSDLLALEVDHVLRPQHDAFVTITSDSRETAVYVDGVLAERSSQFVLTPEDFSGHLVAGAQPFDYDHWSGQLRALAIYSRQLTPDQALAHYQRWTNSQSSASWETDSDNAIAIYRFDERSGKTVHNAAARGPSLLIPDTFEVPEKNFLELPWENAAPALAYFQDIAINIAGFIPLGFFLYAFLNVGIGSRRFSVPLAVTLVGFTVSLTIEILQFFLPSRDSSVTDVISNSLGTVIGVMLFRLAQKPISAGLRALQR
jgi:VanZ family protein